MSRVRARVAAAVILVLVIAVTGWRHSPPPLARVTEPGQFDGFRAQEFLRDFIADGAPRAVGSLGHAAAHERLCTSLTALGCEVIEQPFVARGWNRTAVAMTNVLVRIRGTEPDPQQGCVLVSAHYDSVSRGEGAGDNAAGVACALEITRALKADPPRRDTLVLFTDGEEVGLRGAAAFVAEHPAWKDVGAVVNLDARGSDGPVYIFEVGADRSTHAALLFEVNPSAKTTSLASEAYQHMPNGTDFSVYRRGGCPGFNLAFIGSPRNYHSHDDTRATLDPRTMNQLGTNALALVRALADGWIGMGYHSGHPQSGTSAVWFDFYSVAVVWWPPWLTLVSIGLSLLVLGVVLRVHRHRSTASLLGTLMGATSAACGVLCAIAIGTAFSSTMRWSEKVDMPWPAASIWWGDALLLVVGASCIVVLSRVVNRRRRARRTATCADWDTWLGGWLLIVVLCAVIAWAAPGAIHPLLCPLVAASTVSAVGCTKRWETLNGCALASGTVALLVWAPLEPAFADAFGLGLGGFTALRGALVALAFRPLCD